MATLALKLAYDIESVSIDPETGDISECIGRVYDVVDYDDTMLEGVERLVWSWELEEDGNGTPPEI